MFAVAGDESWGYWVVSKGKTNAAAATSKLPTTWTATDAVKAWREFASALTVSVPTKGTMSWKTYIEKHAGKADEKTLVAPSVLPAFAGALLGWTLNDTLATERTGKEGAPDFAPADAVTHPFVFETKGTDGGVTVGGSSHDTQLLRYLTVGKSRIKRIVLTNMYGLRVVKLDASGALTDEYSVDLRDLAVLPSTSTVATQNATNLARLLNEFRYRPLSRADKIARVGDAAPWNPAVEITDTEWVVGRVSSVVGILTEDAGSQGTTALAKACRGVATLRVDVLAELQVLEMRVGASDKEVSKRTLDDYLTAPAGTAAAAVAQFVRNSALYATTRLLLVRAWEDAGLINPRLYDGGFKKVIAALDTVGAVAGAAFQEAGTHYPALFNRRTAYSWFEPTEDAYIDAVYQLANTYLRDLSDDILGDVYQRQLSLADRKLLGQYYTPRDIIGLILDLAGTDALLSAVEAEDRALRVFDIATGSGGFLVGVAHRSKQRLLEALAAGAQVSPQDWVDLMADGLVGSEITEFSAYLAEVNLVLQATGLIPHDPSMVIPSLRIEHRDSLTLHNPDMLAIPASGQQSSVERLVDPSLFGEWMDLAVGNPPYIGESSIAQTKARLIATHPYWDQFTAAHQDYLYFFLVLGISKLRQGGSFGFITTEYWLNAAGAAPLRRYIAEHCEVERLVLFRDMTLFPDAPGQHNLIITGRRLTDPEEVETPLKANNAKPQVSRYEGVERNPDPPTRAEILDVIRRGTSRKAVNVITFRSGVDVLGRGGKSWAEATMTTAELNIRRAIQAPPDKASIYMSEGVIATPARYRDKRHADDVTIATRNDISNGGIAGIFELTDDEFKTLAAIGLTTEEQRTIMFAANTREIFPYAVVLDAEPDRIIWLPSSASTSDAFPTNMPTLEKHLTRFKSLLEMTIRGYMKGKPGKLVRPWWTAHNPRTDLIAGRVKRSGWSDLAVMNRWGDAKLLSALMPARTIPKSGLFAFHSEDKGSETAYLVGLINSTPILAAADALAPGSIDKEAIRELGLPLLPAGDQASVARDSRALAKLVTSLVREDALGFPLLPWALRSDINIAPEALSAWLPRPKGKANTSTIASAAWLDVEESAPAGTIVGVDVVDDITVVSPRVRVLFSKGYVDLVPTPHDAGTVSVLRCAVLALGFGSTRTDLLAYEIHTSPSAMAGQHLTDRQRSEQRISRYRRLRQDIDGIIVAALTQP